MVDYSETSRLTSKQLLLSLLLVIAVAVSGISLGVSMGQEHAWRVQRDTPPVILVNGVLAHCNHNADQSWTCVV